MIPGRRDLAKEFGVALTTVERGVITLISEGLLRADDRRGTFVTSSFGAPKSEPALAPVAPTAREPVVGTVGVIAPIVPYETASAHESQWPFQILEGCEHRFAAETGLTLRFVNTVVRGGTDLSVSEAANRLLAERVVATILIAHEPTPDVLAKFQSAGVPLILAVFDPVSVCVPQVYIDGVLGGAMAARHLIERGYRPLLYFQPFHTYWAEQRLAGVKSGIESLGMPPHILRVLPVDAGLQVGQADEQQRMARAGAEAAFESGAILQGAGVIAPNDSIAMGFMEAAAARGWKAGRDYGIIGFDDRARDHGLTSLRPPVVSLGEEAARLALGLLRAEDAPYRVALRHRLIARTSTEPRKPATKAHFQGRGLRFTLLELLVVVAILAILMTLTLPVLRHALEQVRLAKCQSNLHQLSLAQFLYLEDATVFAPHRQWVLGSWDEPSLEGIRTGLIFPYLTTVDAYYCPTFALVCGKDTTTRSYVMNWNVAGLNSDLGSQEIWKPTQAHHPSRVALFAEENTWIVPGFSLYTINDGSLCAPDWPLRDTLATFHLSSDYSSPPIYDGSCDVVFLDGHVEIRTTDETLQVMYDVR